MKKLYFLFFVLLLVISLNAQKVIDSSSKKRPTWIKEIPSGKYFKYYSGMSSSKNSLDEAKNLAISDVISEIIMSNEVLVQSEISTIEGETETELITRITKEIKLKGKTTSVKELEKEEEYWESVQTKTDILYRYWILMRIPQKEYLNYDFSKIDLKQTYGATPLIKSIIVPGWGQIQKKETTKGILFLSGFAITLTSGIITYNVSSSYSDDAKTANGADWIKYYNDLSDQYYLASMASFVLAGAIYGYNIFDSISSKGAKIYALQNYYLFFSVNKDSQLLITYSLEF